MKIALSNDMLSFNLKEAVKSMLIEQGHEVFDLGSLTADEPFAYTRAGKLVAKAVQSGEVEKGLLFCGSGMGVAITANKFKGVYAGVCESVFSAKGCRVINDCNVLCMGANIIGVGMAKEMANVFINTSFAENFAPERVNVLRGYLDDIAEIEKENYKE